jgi:hypothetical protein
MYLNHSHRISYFWKIHTKSKNYKNENNFTFSNMQTFLVSSFICINSLYSEKKKLRFTIIRIWEKILVKKHLQKTCWNK